MEDFRVGDLKGHFREDPERTKNRRMRKRRGGNKGRGGRQPKAEARNPKRAMERKLVLRGIHQGKNTKVDN